ncbi:MAG: tRNA 2-thiouridine(34) synthase MnmA [Solirubrobacterales bacterium]
MDTELLEHFLGDRSRAGGPNPGDPTGRAGGAACGDVVELSLTVAGGVVTEVSQSGSGCAAARAAAAAVAELADGATLLEAALIDAAAVSDELGGLSPVGAHAADLAAEALHRALGVAVLTAGEPLLEPPPEGERVLVAVSGGVDSAVAALLEQRRGAEVVAITLELWADPANDGEASCCSASAVRAARALAHAQGIPHLTVDLREAFRAGVVDPFLDGYAEGVTPNPCVRCNGRVRIEPMTEIAERLGAGALATGHYARVVSEPDGPLLAAAADDAKDQTYMLAALPAEVLSRMRFPLGELTKPQVRELAAEAGLPVADKAESQDLCFLAGVGKAGFLAAHGGLADREGEIVDSSGAILGTHRGHHLFTVGQRRGIGVASPEPLYVLRTDAESNRVTVGSVAELDVEGVAIRDVVLHRPASRVGSIRLRYRSQPLSCRISEGPRRALAAGSHERVEVELGAPARAGAPGQTAVLLDGDLVVGHGTIA